MKRSEFTGSAWGIFGWSVLIGLSTFLFLIPLAFVMPRYWKWYYSHIVIDDKQLEFTNDDPYWGAIGWILFTIVTFGIGAYYAEKKMHQYAISHVHVEGEEEYESHFSGSAWGLLGWGIVSYFATLAFLIPLAFVIPLVHKWMNDKTIINERQLVFNHSGPYWGAIGWMLFSLATFGIGSFYAQKRMTMWSTENTSFDQDVEFKVEEE